jgi:uracil-DNA glycosylase family 4
VNLLEPDPSLFDTRFVPPKGSDTPHLMIVGEAPGYNESEQGIPFVGKAGQTLDKAIAASRVDASRIRFYNVIPYRPITVSGWKTSNRTPTPEEIDFYKEFVHKDIRKTKPRVILLVGKSAMRAFSIKETPTIGRTLRYEFEGIPVLTTWHPSFANHNGGEKSRIFTEMVSDITRAWNSTASNDPASRTPFRVVDILDWENVRDELDGDPDIVLDYETSATTS